MFFKIGLADDVVSNVDSLVRTIQIANNCRNYLTEYLIVVDNLLKRKRTKILPFLITLHKCFDIGNA